MVIEPGIQILPSSYADHTLEDTLFMSFLLEHLTSELG